MLLKKLLSSSSLKEKKKKNQNKRENMILNIKKCNLVGEDKYIHLIHLETNYKAVYELTWDCLEYIECAVVKDLASRYPWALGKRWVFESSPGPSLPFQHASYLATCFPRAPWLVEPIQRRLMGSKTSLSALEPGTKTGSVSSRTNVSTVT